MVMMGKFGGYTFLVFVAIHYGIHVKGENITLTISGTAVDLWQYGYRVCDNLQMIFHLKADYQTDIILSSLQSSPTQKYKIGINQGEARITYGGSTATHQSSGSLIKDDEYKPFWLSWADANVVFGKGLLVGEDILVSMSKDPNYLISNISVNNNGVETGYLIIVKSATSQPSEGKQWISPLAMKDVNITDNVIWRQPVSHLGDCSIACYNDEHCVTFTFHKYDKICQGHSVNQDGLNAANYSQEIGSDYFIKG